MELSNRSFCWKTLGGSMIILLSLTSCPPPPAPPPPSLPANTTDVMTMLGVESLEELQSVFREEEIRDERGLIQEKRWYDATDALRLRRVYVYDEEGFEKEHVYYDGNGQKLYTFRMVYDENRNRIGENLFNDKDELISSFTYEAPVPPPGSEPPLMPSQLLDPSRPPDNRPSLEAPPSQVPPPLTTGPAAAPVK